MRMKARLMEATLSRNLSHLDGLQPVQLLLSLLVHLLQLPLQRLHSLLQVLERALHLGTLGRRHLAQQGVGLVLLLLLLLNAGEDAIVDVQGGAHHLHVIASLKETKEPERGFLPPGTRRTQRERPGLPSSGFHPGSHRDEQVYSRSSPDRSC